MPGSQLFESGQSANVPDIVTWMRGPRFWLLYALFWLLLGLTLALADYQRVLRGDGRQAWEPFVQEMTSLAVIGALALLIFRGVRQLEARAWPRWRKLASHAVAALVFCVMHVGLMYAARHLIYHALGSHYATASIATIFAHEAPKDLVTYLILASLAHGLNLWRREQSHRLQVEQARAALAELRMTRLSDQLHPHFLFNSLNAVAGLIEENPRLAVTMVARISDFLRLSLQNDARPFATLREELALMHHYLDIQRLRFEGGLDVAADIEDGMDAQSIPRMLLQPLVENAVKHAMVRPSTPLLVRVVARRHADQRLSISVGNSRVDGPPRGEGLGRGLAIVRERLALHYGDAASLIIEDDSANWYAARLELPPAPLQRSEAVT
ncbi:MAG: histidine kinase [Betaproteobacteria bacterium]|nr:histidine kinase [Betaproteobacteria bacterium]